LHTVATPTAAGFLSGADKGRIDALYASSQATRSASRLIAIDGWPGDPDLRVWRMTGVTPTTVTVSTSGTADANVWYVDLSDDMPPSPLTITALDVRIAGPAGQANVPFGSLVAPRWVLASYDRDNVRAVEIAARIDASTTAAAYQAAHSIAWSGAVAFSSLKRYVIEVTPESGGLALSGTRLLSINMTCTYADSAPVAERFMALLAAKGIFAFEARSNTNDGTNVLTFVDLIDPGRVLTLAGTGKMPKPAANAGFGGALVCHPTGVSLTAFCNRPASEFRALHDGTGMEIRQILQADNANTMVSITTRTGAAGVTILTSSGRNQSYVTNNSAWPGSALINSAPINFPVATPGSSHLRYSASTTPNWTSHVSGGAADVTGQQATTPYAGDSDQTLELFTDGTNHFAGYWFGTYGFHSLTATERALVDEYQLAMTGVLP
jgi:hypothetical protein